MSKELEWRKCRYCYKSKYCSADLMRDHEEDCPKRPSAYKLKLCPKCESVLTKLGQDKWLCIKEGCDFSLGIINGGKLQC